MMLIAVLQARTLAESIAFSNSPVFNFDHLSRTVRLVFFIKEKKPSLPLHVFTRHNNAIFLDWFLIVPEMNCANA